MTDTASLFAQKLKNWRATNGIHGRMTQEQLADLLDVSPDAIGKYERSLSFIRGDLEHRLVTKLGWSNAEIVSCREDWQARQTPSKPSAYRLLDQGVIDELFGGSWKSAIRAMIDFSRDEFFDLPNEFASCEDIFLPIYDAYHDSWATVLHGNEIVAKWSLIPLTQGYETHFRDGRLTESTLTLDSIHRPILPGTYFGYCPALIINKGHEAASTLLISSFTAYLEDLAARSILFHSIGAISCSIVGEQICRGLKMIDLGPHEIEPSFRVWDLQGVTMQESIFARRSPALRQAYANFSKA